MSRAVSGKETLPRIDLPPPNPTDHLPPPTSHLPPPTDHLPPLPTTYHLPPPTDHLPPTTPYRPPTAYQTDLNRVEIVGHGTGGLPQCLTAAAASEARLYLLLTMAILTMDILTLAGAYYGYTYRLGGRLYSTRVKPNPYLNTHAGANARTP